MFCDILAVTSTGKEALSKREEKTKEETIPTKCNVIVHHSCSNKSSPRGNHNHNEAKRDTKNNSNLNSCINRNLSATINLCKCDNEDSGTKTFTKTN